MIPADVEQELASLAQAPLRDIQRTALQVYGRYDLTRALLWLTEEVGELVAAIRKRKSEDDVRAELGDVAAWIVCLCNILELDLETVVTLAFRKEAHRQMTQYGSMKYWR